MTAAERKRLSRERERRGQGVFPVVVRDVIGLADLLVRCGYLAHADADKRDALLMALETYVNEQCRA